MMAFVAKLVLGLIAAIVLIDRLRGKRKIDRAFLTEAVFTLLAAFAFVMVASAFYAVLGQPARALGVGGVIGLLVFLAAYAGFAALWLARMAPKQTPLPRWIAAFGVADIALIGLGGVIAGVLMVTSPA